jgi:hypothetical protein
MKYNSNEIENIIFHKQMNLYTRIDNLLNQRFEELEPDVISDLTSTLIELDDRIQSYKRDLKQKELFGTTYHKIRNNKKIEEISLMEIFSTI